MVTSCAAYKCTTRYKRNCGISFYRFPQDQELRKKWIIATKRKNFVPSKYTVLCSKHFTKDQYQFRPNCNYELLKSDAVPTLFEYFPVPPRKKRGTIIKIQDGHRQNELSLPLETSLSKNLIDGDAHGGPDKNDPTEIPGTCQTIMKPQQGSSSFVSQPIFNEDVDDEDNSGRSQSPLSAIPQLTVGKRPAKSLPTCAPQPKRFLVNSNDGDRTKRLEISVNNLPGPSSVDDVEDEYDKFASHIAAQLRALPVRSFVILQEKIQALVTAERLSCLQNTSANDGSSSDPRPSFKLCD